ncbi:MAG: hypothetical protein K2M82_07030 [Lachnospiraceae bacterium]|nr:hypothetical protein [Lachnospiraceae bacterium]
MWRSVALLKAGIITGGILLGTAGIKAITSDDAKKAYAECTAAALRAKDDVKNVLSGIKSDIKEVYNEAVRINQDLAKSRENSQTQNAEIPVPINTDTICGCQNVQPADFGVEEKVVQAQDSLSATPVDSEAVSSDVIADVVINEISPNETVSEESNYSEENKTEE